MVQLLSNYLFNECEDTKFVTFLINYYDDIKEIITLSSVEKREDNKNDIFLILYEDNIDAFIPYLNKRINDPQIQNPFIFQDSKYELFSYYYLGLSEKSELIYAATILHANKIIKYLLEKQPFSRQIFFSLALAIKRSDFELIKLFSNYIDFPQFVFLSALFQPNPEIIKYVYEKSHIQNVSNLQFCNPPFLHSILFLLNRMPRLWKPHVYQDMNSTPFHFLIAFYIVYKNSFPILDFPLSLIECFSSYFPFGFELYEYVLKQTHSCFWLKFAWCFRNHNLLPNLVIDTFKHFPLKTINFYAFTEIMQSNKFKISFFDFKLYENLPLAFYIALKGDSQLFDSMISKGLDVNNSKHPENASLIHFACISKTITNLTHLLAVPELDINRKDGYGRTAIDIARDPSYRALLINAGCQSSKTQIIYNERDFMNSNKLLHQNSIKGPGQFITREYKIFKGNYSIATSLICADQNIYLFKDKPYEIGTKSKLIPTGPYNFGIITNKWFERSDTNTVTLSCNQKFKFPNNSKK